MRRIPEVEPKSPLRKFNHGFLLSRGTEAATRELVSVTQTGAWEQYRIGYAKGLNRSECYAVSLTERSRNRGNTGSRARRLWRQ